MDDLAAAHDTLDAALAGFDSLPASPLPTQGPVAAPTPQLATANPSAVAATDTKTVQLVVKLLGLVAVLAIVGTIGLLALERSPASVAVVSGLAGTAVGALASLLVSTRSVATNGSGG